METRLRHKIRMELLSHGKSTSHHDEKAILVDDFNVGRPDVENSLEVIEIKSIRKFKHAIGQVLVYAKLREKKPKVILLEDTPMGDKDKNIIRKICESFNIRVEILGYTYLQKYTEDILHDWRFKMNKKHLLAMASNIMKECDCTQMRKEELCINIPISSWKDMTAIQLRHLAKKYNIPSSSSMKKDTLISKLDPLIHKSPQKNKTLTSIHGSFSTPEKKSGVASLKVEQLRQKIKEKGIDLPTKPYIRKDDLLRILSDPSILDQVLEEYA